MRAAIQSVKERRGEAHHSGLVLHRYATTAVTGGGGDEKERRALLVDAIRAGHNSLPVYQAAFGRWKLSLPPLSVTAGLHTEGRLLVGHGEENILEAGLRLHHTYGQPVIPGSALKGLASHYCDIVWGQRPLQGKASCEAQRLRREGEYHRLLFGSTDDGGVIVFHDAWLDPDFAPVRHGLQLDVTTPHHPAWQTEPSRPPSDFDSPVPVSSLSVTGRFFVSVSWNGPEHSDATNWTSLAMQLLKEALREWGVGGKTSSGYGRLVEEALHAKGVSPTTPAVVNNLKRASGTRIKVEIIGARDKGGYVVQEEGRPRGVLNVGSMPEGLTPQSGQTVEVEVHDDAKVPQYRWPTAPKKKGRSRP